MSNKDFTFIDLFSGIGGFRLALEKVGGKCQGFSEINSDAIATYCQNFKETTSHNFGDITKINDLPQHDLMTAGVPCQSWSIAGKNLGFDDDRGQLWNDTIYLLQKNQPKAFIFENVKGLTDPRNKTALDYILQRIKDAGYYANYYLINSYDYGVLQHRQRVYIIGFKNNIHCLRFKLPDIEKHHKVLGDVLEDVFYQPSLSNSVNSHRQFDLLGDIVAQDRSMSLSNKNGLNDYFLFNDLRNGHSTIHSWDILETSNRQKHICLLLLKNRRKKLYGELDGNPLSLNQFISIDSSITQMELDELVSLDILKKEEYLFQYHPISEVLTEEENIILSHSIDNILTIDHVKNAKNIVKKKVNLLKTIGLMKEKKMLVPIEVRYDFKYTKISTGIFGINRIFLPTSDVYPTLVASDGNDFIATCDVFDKNPQTFKDCFLNEIYKPSKFRKINVSEACEIQGFPKDFVLPKSRARWMKLIGNSVSVPVIYALALAIKNTGVFDEGSE